MTAKEMMSYLKANGFVEISSNGSHRKFKNFKTGKQTVVPYHNKDLKKGFEQSILKQDGLKKEEYA